MCFLEGYRSEDTVECIEDFVFVKMRKGVEKGVQDLDNIDFYFFVIFFDISC